MSSEAANQEGGEYPASLDRGLMQRLRRAFAKLEERDRIVSSNAKKRQEHYVGTMPSGRALYEHGAQSIPTREETHQHFAQVEAQFRQDLVILRDWLEQRAVAHARRVANSRITLSQLLVLNYSAPDPMQALCEAIAQMLCYRSGYPLLLTQEQRSAGPTIPQAWAIDDPATLFRQMDEAMPYEDTRVMTDPMGGKTPQARPRKFAHAWMEWSDQTGHNHSPFSERFDTMAAAYGARAAEAAQRALYAEHPILLALSTIASPKRLAAIVIMRDVSERNIALGALVLQVSAQIRQAATDLLADVTVTRRSVYQVPAIGLEFNADYVDWGNHMPLLLLAVSELQLHEGDPLEGYLVDVLLPSMDVMSWRETADATLMVVGIAATVLTLGGAAGFVSAVVALEIAGGLMMAAGIASASWQIYDGSVSEGRMQTEALLRHISADLQGYENGLVAADGVRALVIELLTLGLFPPSSVETRAMVRRRARIPDPRPKVGELAIADLPDGRGALSDAGPAGLKALPVYPDYARDAASYGVGGVRAADLDAIPVRSVVEVPDLTGRATAGQRGVPLRAQSVMDDMRASRTGQARSPDDLEPGIRTRVAEQSEQELQKLLQADLEQTALVVHATSGQAAPPTQSAPLANATQDRAALASRAVTASARAVPSAVAEEDAVDLAPDDVVVPQPWDDIVLTFNAKEQGRVLSSRVGVTRNAASYNRNYLADLIVEDSGYRFSGRKAYTLVYKLKSDPTFEPEEIAKIYERVALMNRVVEELIIDSGFALRLKHPDDPHVKTHASRLVDSAMKAARKRGNKNAGDDVDVDEVWARNLFEVALNLSSNRPELEATLQIELPSWINGLFGQLDTALRDMIVANSADGYETLILNARVELIP